MKWTDTLSACSFKLMTIIMDAKQKELNGVQEDMALIQKELISSQSMPGYAELDSQLNKRLDKLERGVISFNLFVQTGHGEPYPKNVLVFLKQKVNPHMTLQW